MAVTKSTSARAFDYALAEWVKLLHVYSGMILFGGGIFLFIVFRLGDRAPTQQERAAVADVARPLFGGWRIAALAQLVTGFVLVALKGLAIPGWLVPGWVVQSIFLYLFALSLWWVGFGHALRAAQHDALYQDEAQVVEYQHKRDRQLFLVVVITAWVLITMIYRDDADLARFLRAFWAFSSAGAP